MSVPFEESGGSSPSGSSGPGHAMLDSMQDAGQSGPDIEALNAILRESEERYRTLFHLSPVAVYSIDASGRIQQFNLHAATLWGQTPTLGDTGQRFCGSLRMYLPDGTYLPHDRCPMATVVNGEIAEARDAEVVIERPDGSRITVVVNIVPLKNEKGEITGAINCFYDVTERSQLQLKTREQAEALADLHRRKDEFLAMLGHELRNPLAPILNGVQLLRLQQSGDPRHRRALDIIERQVGQLVHLVDDLLEVSRITSGRIQLHREQINVSDLVERALETTRPAMHLRQHELTVTLPEEALWLEVDPARMEQVLVNLLTNATKYTEKGGHIWLIARADGDAIELQVRDSGIGIAAELQPHIFGLFTQAERSLDRSQGGLGIGLCLVKKLVEMHGGSVTVGSALGRGSAFVVRMPRMVNPLLLPLSSGKMEVRA